jgi:hypothetical protein
LKHVSRAEADALLAIPFPPAPNLKADNWLSLLIALWVMVVVEKHLVRFGGGRTKDFLRLCYESERNMLPFKGNLLVYVRVWLVSKRKRSCVTWRDHIFVYCFGGKGDLLFDDSRD